MTTLDHFQIPESLQGITETLNRYHDAGVDPAFDGGMEELERQFDELRFMNNHH
jgi:hypothetical protein